MADSADHLAKRQSFLTGTLPRVIGLLFFLYTFLVSIGLLGKAFKLFGGGVVESLIQDASNPLLGLFIGILATTLVQSSSSTTSLVVALVGSGTMPVATAIPVVMGANIGTSVTNTLVSLGHLTRSKEFSRAFAASTVHDFFNILTVVILFPLQWSTNMLGHGADLLARSFEQAGGLHFASPLKVATEPAVKGLVHLCNEQPLVLVVIALVMLFGSLRYLVVMLKSLVLSKIEALFDQVIFRNAARAMFFGLLLTTLVQSSSITTSLAVPLAGAGILTLQQIFPYTLGANVGTTVTAILASMAVGHETAVAVAFAHLLFNVLGICIIWPFRPLRNVPIRLAEGLSRLAQHSRVIPLVYIVVCFYALPFAAIILLR
jgi:sodium-dependent phosphate cotransporter